MEFKNDEIMIAWDDTRMWAIHGPTFEVAQVERTGNPDRDLTAALRTLASVFGSVGREYVLHRNTEVPKGVVEELTDAQWAGVVHDNEDRGRDIDDYSRDSRWAYFWYGGLREKDRPPSHHKQWAFDQRRKGKWR